MSTPLEVRLRVELREARAQLAALDNLRRALQDDNEAAYRAAYDATGGPRFDKAKPFGRLTSRSFTDPTKRAAARMLQRTAEETS
ncbi:hypothetical protein [Streptomyces flavidovirens]